MHYALMASICTPPVCVWSPLCPLVAVWVVWEQLGFLQPHKQSMFVTVEMTSATSSHHNITLWSQLLWQKTKNKLVSPVLVTDALQAQTFIPLSSFSFSPSFHFGDVCAARLRAVSLISPETPMSQRAKRRPAGAVCLYTLIHEHISLTCSLISALNRSTFTNPCFLQQNTVSSIRA